MKCEYCQYINPDTVEQCLRCGRQLSAPAAVRVAPKATRKSNPTGRILGAAIAVLSAAVVIIAGIVAYQALGLGSHRSSGGGFGGGGFGGGGYTPPVNAITVPAPVTLTTDDPSIEIYSFLTDTYDILIGTQKTVTFTAEIYSETALAENSVSVIDDAGTVLGYMTDTGENGDAAAGDGVYTLCADLYSDAVKNILYHVRAGNALSSKLNICFYKEFSQDEYTLLNDVSARLNEAVEPYAEMPKGWITDNKLENAKSAAITCLTQLRTEGAVADYQVKERYFKIRLTNEIPFTYVLRKEGEDSLLGEGTIATYQPFASLYPEDLQSAANEAVDGAAQAIHAEIPGFTFRTNLNDGAVTLETVKKLADNQIVLWHGHGGIGGSGSMIATGQKPDFPTSFAYCADLFSDRIEIVSAAGETVYAVTGGFIEKYVGSMNGAFVYLAACSSAADATDPNARYHLVDSFIRKGAHAVVGVTESIPTDYDVAMLGDTVRRMVEKDQEDNAYYTLSEALDYAKEKNRELYDKDIVQYYPSSGSIAADYRFKEEYGEMSGSVKSADTMEPVENALVRIYREGELVGNLRTNAEGYYNAKLAAGEYVVRISCGYFKNAKMGVTVVAGTTTYNETFLLLKTDVESGHATGTVSSATTGETVEGVSLKLRKWWNNYDGEVVYRAVTDENGLYDIYGICGLYTMEYSKDGYITGYKNVVIGVVDFAPQNVSISMVMPEDGNYRIVLSWRDKPKDLDSHLTGPNGNGGRFHLYYQNRNQSNPSYMLDIDNTNIISRPDIPETITIMEQKDGVYRYSVHDYTNSGNASSTALSESNATVNVYKGDQLVATFHVPTNASGTIWTVFELNGDELTAINTMANGSDTSNLF